jgi:5-methylcytosine-specific restriction protein A
MKKPTIQEIRKGMRRFAKGDRPWPEREIDWYLAAEDGKLFPLKYTYGLSVNLKPSTYTTNQAKSAMRHLGLGYVSMRENHREEDFDSAVKRSLKDRKGRKRRLKTANKQPWLHAVIVKVCHRNPDVVAEVLERANGNCEKCKNTAPFIRKADSTPYLEVHHIKQLANGGEDSVNNAIGLCPNCHREAHYG